jgi:hypothetical protein
LQEVSKWIFIKAIFYFLSLQIMVTKHKEKKSQNNKTALFIPAGLLLGIWWWFVCNNVVSGMFIGLGAGMVVFAILTFMKK